MIIDIWLRNITGTLPQNIRTYNQGKEFGIEKFSMLIMKIAKVKQQTEKSPNDKSIRTAGEKENHKYLEVGTIKQTEMKEKIRKEYIRKTRKLPELSSLAYISSEE